MTHTRYFLKANRQNRSFHLQFYRKTLYIQLQNITIYMKRDNFYEDN